MRHIFLSQYKKPSEVCEAFKKENQLGQLILKEIHRNEGILEAMAVMVPERFGLEIYEVYEWVQTSKDKRIPTHAKRLLNEILMENGGLLRVLISRNYS